MCFHLQSLYTCMILTVTEGFIVGLFFIQAPQEWMKANTKAFLNYTMFDTKKDVIQGVVTYMSRVEAFATAIKIESSDQSPFGGPIKGSRWPPNCYKSTIKNALLQSDLWPLKIKRSRASEGTIKRSSILFADQKIWSRSQTLLQVTYKWLPLVIGSVSVLALFTRCYFLEPSSCDNIPPQWHCSNLLRPFQSN